MRLLLLPLDPRLASSRLRMVELAPHLEDLGIRCTVEPYPDGWSARRRLLGRGESFDAVVVQKRLPSAFEAHLWRRLGPPLIFDYDDALPFRQRPHRGDYASRSRGRRFARAVRAADALACGSAALADLAPGPAKPHAILPTAVPVDVPQRGEPTPGRPLRLGWIGGRGNLAELDSLAPILADLARRRPLEVVVIADAPWEAGAAAGVPTRQVPWTAEGQARALAELDVGLMPLEDTPWNRGKCAYKLLQYMAAGVPGIGSPVGMNRDLIRHDENGLLASGPGDWRRELGRVLDDGDLRRRLGAAGRATVVEDFAFGAVARRWAAFLETIAGGAAGAAR